MSAAGRRELVWIVGARRACGAARRGGHRRGAAGARDRRSRSSSRPSRSPSVAPSRSSAARRTSRAGSPARSPRSDSPCSSPRFRSSSRDGSASSASASSTTTWPPTCCWRRGSTSASFPSRCWSTRAIRWVRTRSSPGLGWVGRRVCRRLRRADAGDPGADGAGGVRGAGSPRPQSPGRSRPPRRPCRTWSPRTSPRRRSRSRSWRWSCSPSRCYLPPVRSPRDGGAAGGDRCGGRLRLQLPGPRLAGRHRGLWGAIELARRPERRTRASLRGVAAATGRRSPWGWSLIVARHRSDPRLRRLPRPRPGPRQRGRAGQPARPPLAARGARGVADQRVPPGGRRRQPARGRLLRGRARSAPPRWRSACHAGSAGEAWPCPPRSPPPSSSTSARAASAPSTRRQGAGDRRPAGHAHRPRRLAWRPAPRPGCDSRSRRCCSPAIGALELPRPAPGAGRARPTTARSSPSSGRSSRARSCSSSAATTSSLYELRGSRPFTHVRNFYDPYFVRPNFELENVGSKFDFDSVTADTLARFPYVITTRAAYASGPPPRYRPVAETANLRPLAAGGLAAGAGAGRARGRARRPSSTAATAGRGPRAAERDHDRGPGARRGDAVVPGRDDRGRRGRDDRDRAPAGRAGSSPCSTTPPGRSRSPAPGWRPSCRATSTTAGLRRTGPAGRCVSRRRARRGPATVERPPSAAGG